MVKITIIQKDGTRFFLLGLSAGNIKHLQNGRPMRIELEPLGGEGAVGIMYGETEADIMKEMRRVFGPLPGDDKLV